MTSIQMDTRLRSAASPAEPDHDGSHTREDGGRVGNEAADHDVFLPAVDGSLPGKEDQTEIPAADVLDMRQAGNENIRDNGGLGKHLHGQHHAPLFRPHGQLEREKVRRSTGLRKRCTAGSEGGYRRVKTSVAAIKEAGGAAAIADASNGAIKKDAVYKWPKIGVPDRHWELLIELAGTSPDELFEANRVARAETIDGAAA